MIKHGTQNCILVEIEKISEDEYNLPSGVKLFINTAYVAEQKSRLQLDVNPENQRIYGTCVAIPEKLTKGDIVKYEANDLRFTDSIEPEVKIGDRVYFSYVAVNKGGLLEFEGKCYCNIPYSAILCVVRDIPKGWIIDIDKAMNYCKNNDIDFDVFMKGAVDNMLDLDFKIEQSGGKTIIPIGGNILCEEYYGKDAEMIEVNGFKIHVNSSKSSPIITDIVRKPSDKMARVKIVGSPLKEDEMELMPGDLIAFPEKFGFPNNIEGTDYLFLKYWDLHGVLEEENI